jgi:hypothetical protein
MKFQQPTHESSCAKMLGPPLLSSTTTAMCNIDRHSCRHVPNHRKRLTPNEVTNRAYLPATRSIQIRPISRLWGWPKGLVMVWAAVAVASRAHLGATTLSNRSFAGCSVAK